MQCGTAMYGERRKRLIPDLFIVRLFLVLHRSLYFRVLSNYILVWNDFELILSLVCVCVCVWMCLECYIKSTLRKYMILLKSTNSEKYPIQLSGLAVAQACEDTTSVRLLVDESAEPYHVTTFPCDEHSLLETLTLFPLYLFGRRKTYLKIFANCKKETKPPWWC